MKLKIKLKVPKESVSETLIYPYDLDKALLNHGVDSAVVNEINVLVKAVKHLPGAGGAYLYAKAILPAFEQYGVDGVKDQIRNLLNAVTNWNDPDSKHCRKVLTRWIKT